MMQRLLFVDSDRTTREFVARSLNRVGEVTCAATAREARQQLGRCRPDLAILEARLLDGSGLDLLVELQKRCPWLPVVIVATSGSQGVCAEAFRRGAADFLMKPVSAADLRRSVVSELALALARAGSPAPVHRAACVQRAARYVEDHYAEPLRLETVADAVGMSPYSLSRAFKSTLNVNFNHFRRLVRVAKARQLLATGPRSVTEIAKAVGYGLAYFDRVFRQATGISPTTYRRWTRSANGQDPTRHRGRQQVATRLS
jgi:YesN/AraC family two-component response regulator